MLPAVPATFLRALIRRTPLHGPLSRMLARRRQRAELAEWERAGRPVPPPHAVKQRTLLAYAGDWRLRQLVETGTYRGDMVHAMLGHFDRIISIELGADLHAAAVARFRHRAEVELIQGDSGSKIAAVVAGLSAPALFWLDGHYSAGDTARGEHDTPIYQELSTVLAPGGPDHVVIVDDARCFGRDEGYPTIAELIAFVHTLRPAVRVVVEDDMIRVTPS